MPSSSSLHCLRHLNCCGCSRFPNNTRTTLMTIKKQHVVVVVVAVPVRPFVYTYVLVVLLLLVGSLDDSPVVHLSPPARALPFLTLTQIETLSPSVYRGSRRCCCSSSGRSRFVLLSAVCLHHEPSSRHHTHGASRESYSSRQHQWRYFPPDNGPFSSSATKFQLPQPPQSSSFVPG